MIGERISKLRKEQGLSQQELSVKLDLTQRAVSLYEVGKRFPPHDVLIKLASAFGTTVDYILGIEPEKHLPMIALTDIDGLETTNDEFYLVTVFDDSLAPRIQKRDTLVIKRQTDFTSGDLCVVVIGHSEAVIMKVDIRESGIMLLPNNPSYTPVFYSTNDMETLPIKIVGKAVELRGVL